MNHKAIDLGATAYTKIDVPAVGDGLVSVDSVGPIGGNVDPVSYTHLDVYKRQVHGFAMKLLRVDAVRNRALLS